MQIRKNQNPEMFLLDKALENAGMSDEERLVVAVDGFEGPLDVLLVMAKGQKVDLKQMSILALVEQYLLFIKQARNLRLELAADYLVMAAWLAYLKSRLLLPEPEKPSEEEESAEALAARLAYQLGRLNAIREASESLMLLPRLGRDIFSRGQPEVRQTASTVQWGVSLYDLLLGYGQGRMREARSIYHIKPPAVFAVEDSLRRLLPIMGKVMTWTELSHFLPNYDDKDPVVARSAIATTFVACLEMARKGLIELQQKGVFQPIYMRSCGVVGD